MRVILIIPIIFLLNIIIRETLPYLFNKLFSSSKKSSKVSVKVMFLDSLIIGILGCILYYLFYLITADNTNKVYSYLASSLLVSIFPTYDYIIKPVIYSLVNRKRRLKEYEEYIFLNGYSYKVFELDTNLINIYASGVIEKSKAILICKGMINSANEETIKGLIFHEIYHLSKNHLLKLYLSSVFCCLLFLLSSNLLTPHINSLSAPGLYVFLNGCLLGLLLVLIPGFVQKKMEYNADTFASQKIGSDKYIAALNNLDVLTNGGVSKGGINYPTLTQRINSINDNKKI